MHPRPALGMQLVNIKWPPPSNNSSDHGTPSLRWLLSSAYV
jgi:hypothetical protein